MDFTVYFIKSDRNGKIYVGSTNKNISERVKEHNTNSNTYTRNNGPWKLIYYEEYACKKCAQKREKFYKTGFGKTIKYIIVETMEDKANISSGTGAIG